MQSALLILVGGLIGLGSNFVMECWKRSRQRTEMAKVIASRLQLHTRIWEEINDLLSAHTTNPETIRSAIVLIINQLELRGEYAAFMQKMGRFASEIVKDIMTYFDFLELYRRGIITMLKQVEGRPLQGADVQQILDGFHDLRLQNYACLMRLESRGLLDGRDHFERTLNALRDEMALVNTLGVHLAGATREMVAAVCAAYHISEPKLPAECPEREPAHSA